MGCQMLFLYILVMLTQQAEMVLHNGSPIRNNYYLQDLAIQKVSFTQKGYIQFLRYISDVPPLTDYTFCLWVRSNNLTYSHPLLSYSKHDEERLIRVWISPAGTHINLEILEHTVFNVPVKFTENHWYHVCQSWSSYQASWILYLNGKLKASGIEPKLRNAIIKGGGDVVVGQEYTDFDKGLEDGIEGDVFGFNFVLSSTSVERKIIDIPLRRHYNNKPKGTHRVPLYEYSHPTHPTNDIPSVLSYFQISPNRKGKAFMDYFDVGFFESTSRTRVKAGNKWGQFGSRILNDIEDYSEKPLGLKLVELSYNCILGRGSPITGKEVLISWTRTPVRVFGGAILRQVPPFCVN